MKKKLIEILEKNLDYKPHVITGVEKCADEIITILQNKMEVLNNRISELETELNHIYERPNINFKE